MDALIGSVAVANELPVYTCNPDDFTGMAELELVVVPHPRRALKHAGARRLPLRRGQYRWA